MFEHIHFQQISFDIPSTGRMLGHKLKQSGMLESSLPIKDFYETHTDEVDFSLEGSSRAFFPPPSSTTARQSLFCLDVFGIMDAGSRFFTHRKNYPSYLLLYTYGGKGKLNYENKDYLLEQNCGCFIDCRQEHMYQTFVDDNVSTHWEHSILHFTGPTAKLLFDAFFQDGNPLFHTTKSSSYQQNLEDLLRSCQDISPFREFETSMLLEKLLIDIIKEKYENNRMIPDYIIYLKKYMENHFEQPLVLDELAAFANISKYHLVREFKKYVGFPIHEYLTRLRLERAKFLLTNTKLTLGQICQMSGFSNYSNFYKLFCKNIGVSPQQYRNGIEI